MLKKFKVLPTNSDFLNLTDEQIEELYAQETLDAEEASVGGATSPIMSGDSEKRTLIQAIDPDYDRMEKQYMGEIITGKDGEYETVELDEIK